ncbi:type 2C protein phosphatase PTC5 [Rhodotorula paludigena]|uniref:type 2C protein phosphatase PTC5 n=1 Tax=Rhodotorula paludigena TaxID=86838 RepID=UPI003182348F
MPTPRRLPLAAAHWRPSAALLHRPAPRPYSTTVAPSRRSLLDLTLIGILGASVTGFLLYRRTGDDMAQHEGDRPSFTVPVVEQTGGTSKKTLNLLTAAETNARLKENEASFAVSRRNNPLLRYDTNNLASNSPIEDSSCCTILERNDASKVQGDLVFFGVFDGHSGWQTSHLLSSALVPYVARELDLVFRGADPYLSLLSPSPSKPSSSSSIFSLFSSSPSPHKPQLDQHDPIMQQAIKNAFTKMDHEIVSAPVRLLDKLEKEGKLPSMAATKSGGFGVEHSEALNTLLPALSGSCALLAFLDAGRNKLHVAVTGDSRAVMGVWVPDGKDGGKWRVEPLSEDQTGRNPKEVARIQSEHPPNEADTVIVRGRVLGGLEPTRAFGDARYKWPPGQQQKLAAAFHPGSVRGPPRNYLTPPYVTATPEVVSVDLSAERPRQRKSIGSFLPVSSPGEPPATRFVVLATDGLYDRLDNQEIVSLVGAHLCGVRGPQTRQAVLAHSTDPTAVSGPYASHAPRQEPMRGEGEVYTFEDGNLATHLMRNSLGGAKRKDVSVLLSIPAPLSRRYRDDITCTVILLGDPARDGEGGSGGVYRREEGFDTPLKPKL